MERVLQSRDPNVGGGTSPPSLFPSPSLSKPKDQNRRSWRRRVVESNSPTPPEPPLPTPPAHLPPPSSSREGLRPRKKEVNYDTTFHKDLDPIIRPRAAAKKQKTREASEVLPEVDDILTISDGEPNANDDFIDDSNPENHFNLDYHDEDQHSNRSSGTGDAEREDTFFTCHTPPIPQDAVHHQSSSSSGTTSHLGISSLPNRSKRKRSSHHSDTSDANLVEDLFHVAAQRVTQIRRSPTSFDPLDDDQTIFGDPRPERGAPFIDKAPSSGRRSNASNLTASHKYGTSSPPPMSALSDRLCIPPYVRSRLACFPPGRALEEARALAARPSSLMQPAIMHMLLTSWTSRQGPLTIVKPYLTQDTNSRAPIKRSGSDQSSPRTTQGEEYFTQLENSEKRKGLRQEDFI